MWRFAVVVSFLVLGLSASGLAQRGKLRGKLVDDQGKAQAGVPVKLLARVHPKMPVLPLLDHTEVTSRENGRFEAQLCTGIEYGAYAVKPDGQDRYRWTPVTGGVQAGETRILEFQSVKNGVVRIRVDGREAWAAEAPLRFTIQATPTGEAPWVTGDFDAEGKKALPMMPASSIQVVVRGKSGTMLARSHLKIGVDALAKRATRQADLPEENKAKEALLFVAPGILRLRLAPPVEMLIKVTAESKEGGLLKKLVGGKKTFKPVPGARIWLHDTSHRVLVGTTDDKGLAIVRVPEQWSGTQPILVEADGYAETAANLRRDRVAKDRDIEALRKKGEADATLPLLPGKQTRTRILLGEGKPAARMAVLLTSAVSMGENSWISLGKPYLFWTDDKGQLELPGRISEMSGRLDLVLDLAARASLSEKGQVGPTPLVTLYQGSRLPEELPKSIDVSRFTRLQILVQNPPGAERQSSEILLGRIMGKALDEESVKSLLTDPKGRVTVLMPSPGPWAIGACSNAGIKLAQLQLEAGAKVVPHVIRLNNALFIEGIVRTSGEEPLVGTRVRCSSRQANRPELGLLGEVLRFTEILNPICDERGRFKLAVPEPERKYTLRFSVMREGGGSMSSSSWNHEVQVGKESKQGVEITIDPGN